MGKTKQCPTCGESFTVPTAVPPLPSETETYGLSQVKPPPSPSPFKASLSATVSKPINAPTEMANSFSAPMPEVAKSADNPFTIAVPPTATPDWVTESENSPVVKIGKVAHGVSAADDESENVSIPVPIFIGLGVGLLVLILIGIGISNSGGGGSGGGGSRVDSDLAPPMVRLEMASKAVLDFYDAFVRGNESDMQNARLRFGVLRLEGLSSEYQSVHEATRSAMIDLEVYGRSRTQAWIDSSNRYTRALEREAARLDSGGR